MQDEQGCLLFVIAVITKASPALKLLLIEARPGRFGVQLGMLLPAAPWSCVQSTMLAAMYEKMPL